MFECKCIEGCCILIKRFVLILFCVYDGNFYMENSDCCYMFVCFVGMMVVFGIVIIVMMFGVVLFIVVVVMYFKVKWNKESKLIYGLKVYFFFLIKCFCLIF